MKINDYVVEKLVEYIAAQKSSSEKLAMTNLEEKQMSALRGSYTTYQAIESQIEILKEKAKRMIEDQND